MKRYLSWFLGFFLLIALPLTDLFEFPHVRAITLAALGGLFLLEGAAGGHLRRPPAYLIAGGVFALTMLAGVGYSRAPNYGLLKSTLFASYFVLLGYMVYCWSDDRQRATWFFHGIIAGGFFILGLFLVRFGSPVAMMEYAEQYYRFSLGETGNPIHLARYLGIFALLAFVMGMSAKSVMAKLALVGSTILAIMYIGLTGSKGPVVALFCAYVAAGYFFSRRGLQTWVLLGIGSFAFAGGIALFASFMPEEFVNERVFAKLNTLSNRLPVYLHTLQVFERGSLMELVFGHGTGDFGFATRATDIRAYPHNILLECFYENGILGGCFLMLALFLPLYSAFGLRRVLADDKDGRKLLAMALGSYVFWLVNSQFTGDLGSNSFLGTCAALLTSVSLTLRKRGRVVSHAPDYGAAEVRAARRPPIPSTILR